MSLRAASYRAKDDMKTLVDKFPCGFKSGIGDRCLHVTTCKYLIPLSHLASDLLSRSLLGLQNYFVCDMLLATVPYG